jgi:hypothetical protein
METKPLQLNLECHDLIDEIKKTTKLPKKYVVELAVKEYYKKIQKEDK